MSTVSEHTAGNLQFFLSRHDRKQGPWWLVNVRRVSDGHRLDQFSVAREVTPDEWPAVAVAWAEENPGKDQEPPPVPCKACGRPLEADDDTTYQFDNALWLTADGGYGMFVESEEFLTVSDFWLTVDEDRRVALLRAATRRRILAEIRRRPYHPRGWRWLVQEAREPSDVHPTACPMPLPDELADEWRAWRERNRTDRVVICHECAHDLCDKVPWIKEWLDPHRSHSHRTDYVEAHPDHWGWDYDHRDEKAAG